MPTAGQEPAWDGESMAVPSLDKQEPQGTGMEASRPVPSRHLSTCGRWLLWGSVPALPRASMPLHREAPGNSPQLLPLLPSSWPGCPPT